MKIQLGYTPDADDAYMLFGLLANKIDTQGWEFEAFEQPVPVLNDFASRGTLDVTMISAAAYPLVQKRYTLCDAGSSFGLGAGPVIVARQDADPQTLREMTVAIPGSTTTAYAMLQLLDPVLRTRVLPMGKLLPAVETGLVDCALVIHQEFVTYQQYGLKVVVDLGKWWAKTYDALPMPVTNCVIKRDLPAEIQRQICTLISSSIKYAKTNHAEAMQFAMQYSAGAKQETIEKFIYEYVNDLSISMGKQGLDALKHFYNIASKNFIIPAVNEENLTCNTCNI